MILVDTGPFVALCDPRDELHARAKRALGTLAADRFVTCEAVLVEAHFHLRRPHARGRLWDLLRELEVDVLGGVEQADFRQALEDWLVKYEDHEPDWADACLAVLAGRVPGVKVWTYDREFRTRWRKPNGRAIPLVG